MKKFCQSFSFVADAEANILILGSMPGVRSLQAQEYYAHPRNSFWEIMGELFGAGRRLPCQKRLALLRKNRIALWDVAFRCRRQGSLDADMQDVVPNDFVLLFNAAPNIETIFFNGRKAEQLFRRLILKNLGPLAQTLKFKRLPSTSPAHASRTRRQKLNEWKKHLRTANL